VAVGGSNRRLPPHAKGQSRVDLTAMSGGDRRKAQGGVRASPAAETSPKAVQPSRDRGCHDHRILRRVPADGRHPGSSRGVSFTRDAHGWSWRSSASSDPWSRPKAVATDTSSSREGERGVRVNERARQGCQRLDRIHTVGTQRPRFASDAVRLRHEGHVSMTVRRSGPGRRETSCPPVTPYGAQDSVGHPRRASGESEPGTHEVRAHAVSFGWQKSVGCIARLSRREVARPVGASKGASQEEVRSPA